MDIKEINKYKREYNKKKYTELSMKISKDISIPFKELCKKKGVSYNSVLCDGIKKYMEVEGYMEKTIIYENGSINDCTPKCESFTRIPCNTETWENIALAVNESFGYDDDLKYDDQTIQAEYPHYLMVFKDGVITLVL